MHNEVKKKILFVITKSNWGGAQRYVFDLATSLKDTYEVHVALGGNGKLKEMLEAHRIQTHIIHDLTRDIDFKKEWHALMNLSHIIKKVRPDILHLNSSKAAAFGALLGRIQRVPRIIFTAHAWAWNEDRSFFARIIIALIHWLTVRLAHRTITVSHAVYDQMARLPFTKRRMRVVHLGITPLPTLSYEQARGQLLAHAPKLAQGAPWILSIGELHPVKGFSFALESIAELKKQYPKIQYVIIGEGDERATLEQQIRSSHLENTVHLLGHIDGAAMLIPAAQIFVIPSLSEAFGYVALEAGRAVVPIVASDVGGLRESVGIDGGILVTPRNSNALYEGIHEALTNTRPANDRALTLRERVETYFTRERMVAETIPHYNS